MLGQVAAVEPDSLDRDAEFFQFLSKANDLLRGNLCVVGVNQQAHVAWIRSCKSEERGGLIVMGLHE